MMRFAMVLSMFLAACGKQEATPSAPSEVERLQAECDKKDGKACTELAFAYAGGHLGTVKDIKKTEALLTKACGLNYGRACGHLAFDYATGSYSSEMEPDWVRAAQFGQRGCDLADLASCADIASRLSDGKGVPKDLERAHRIRLDACAKGSGLACFDLADSYQSGEAKPEGDRGVSYYRERACTLGEKGACDPH